MEKPQRCLESHHRLFIDVYAITTSNDEINSPKHRGICLMKKLLFLIALFFLCAGKSYACSCAGTAMPCESYWTASAVFVGTVSYSTTASKPGGHDEGRRVFRFTIEKAFRGVEGSEVEVSTGLGGGDCGYPFQLGARYLVYAHADDAKRLGTSICSRTRPADAAADDLEYFQALSNAEPGGRIFGRVRLQHLSEIHGNASTPVEGVKLLLAGPGGQYEAITDDKGNYSVSGVRPGSYQVKVNLPEGTSVHQSEQQVKVAEKGCAEASFWIQPDTRVTGRVLDSQGLPAADVLMELVPVESDQNSFPSYVKSNHEGRYEMKLVPPGRYLLGVRVTGSGGSTYVPYPQTYYPGVREQSSATVISLTEGQHFRAHDLILPPRFVDKQLNGIVLDASGQPVQGATVWLKEIQYKNSDMPYRRETDDQGRFSFPAYEGIKYRLNAYLDGKNGVRRQSEPLELVVSPSPETVKLVLR